VKFGIGLAPLDRWASYDDMADAVAAAEKAGFDYVTVRAVTCGRPRLPVARCTGACRALRRAMITPPTGCLSYLLLAGIALGAGSSI